MNRRTKQTTKNLYSSCNEGITTRVRCRINRSESITISSEFGKQAGWKGGAITNPNCGNYLGIHIAERVLGYVFKNVKRMPANNPGYDVICNYGKLIDIKSACLGKYKPYQNAWIFNIAYNITPDYFLCIAFDNRKDLNPKHIWLIPGHIINQHKTATISRSTVAKWSQYELVDKLNDSIVCCDVMKGH